MAAAPETDGEDAGTLRIRALRDLPKGERGHLPRRMTSGAEAERWMAALERAVGEALDALGRALPEGARGRALSALRDFPALYEDRPLRDNSGGSGFNDSLWLFVMARALNPALLVESGTHRGHSAWLFRRACPEAEIWSFDISWDQLVHREPDVNYRRSDWTLATPRLKPPPARAGSCGALLFLDDHIDHARRIEEAEAAGFRTLLLDDNFPAHHLYATGGPPLPTLAMVEDASLEDGAEIAWERNGKAYAWTFRRGAAERARALVEHSFMLPELAPLTRFPAGSNLTFAKLTGGSC